MSLVGLLILLVVCGFGLWAVNRFIPMQLWVKRLLNGVVVVALVLICLSFFGVFGYINQFGGHYHGHYIHGHNGCGW